MANSDREECLPGRLGHQATSYLQRWKMQPETRNGCLKRHSKGIHSMAIPNELPINSGRPVDQIYYFRIRAQISLPIFDCLHFCRAKQEYSVWLRNFPRCTSSLPWQFTVYPFGSTHRIVSPNSIHWAVSDHCIQCRCGDLVIPDWYSPAIVLLQLLSAPSRSSLRLHNYFRSSGCSKYSAMLEMVHQAMLATAP